MNSQKDDIFFEQLFKKKKTITDRLLQTAIFVLTVGISMIVFMALTSLFGTGNGAGSIQMLIGTAAIAGIVYVGYKLFIRLDVEFEYIYLNGEIDFDKIISKADRERLITVKASSFEQFGKYAQDKAKIDGTSFDKKFDFTSHTGKEVYYAVVSHKEFKKTLILFEPDDRILGDMVKYIPSENPYKNLKLHKDTDING